MVDRFLKARNASIADSLVWFLLLVLFILYTYIFPDQKLRIYFMIPWAILFFVSFIPLRIIQMLGFNRISEKSDQVYLKDLIWFFIFLEVVYGLFGVFTSFFRFPEPIIALFVGYIRGITLALFGFLVFKLKRQFKNVAVGLCFAMVATGLFHFTKISIPAVLITMIAVSVYEALLFRKAMWFTDDEFFGKQ
jgi:hypothetical protein